MSGFNTRFLNLFVCLSVLFMLSLPVRAAEDGLVLHLPFDGNLKPAVGVVDEPAVATPEATFVEGRHGQAVELKGKSNILLHLPQVVTGGEYTIAFWLKPLWHPADDLPHPVFEVPSAPEGYDKIGWSASQILFSKGWSESISPNGF